MIKAINVGEKELTLSTNIFFAFNFKNQFGYDVLTVVLPIISQILENMRLSAEDLSENQIVDLSAIVDGISGLELVDLIGLIWAMAKTNDPTIPPPEQWLKQFDEFPIYDILKEVIPDLMQSAVTKKKTMPSSMENKTKTRKDKKQS